jgi:rRNA maturation protein Nop10
MIPMKRMRRCPACNAYTLDEMHCGKAAPSPHPPKFSYEDRYAKYRRAALAGES